MSYYTNPKFYAAMLLDAVGQDDKAMAMLGVKTFEQHQEYRLNVAVTCLVAAVPVAFIAFPWTLAGSAALGLVAARKMQIREKKEKQHAAEQAAMSPVQFTAALDSQFGGTQVDKAAA